MLNRGIVALAIANAADLFVIRVADPGVVRLAGGVLEIGPGASWDAIASTGCRRDLARKGIFDERAVMREVEAYGYRYVAPVQSWGSPLAPVCAAS